MFSLTDMSLAVLKDIARDSKDIGWSPLETQNDTFYMVNSQSHDQRYESPILLHLDLSQPSTRVLDSARHRMIIQLVTNLIQCQGRANTIDKYTINSGRDLINLWKTTFDYIKQTIQEHEMLCRQLAPNVNPEIILSFPADIDLDAQIARICTSTFMTRTTGYTH